MKACYIQVQMHVGWQYHQSIILNFESLFCFCQTDEVQNENMTWKVNMNCCMFSLFAHKPLTPDFDNMNISDSLGIGKHHTLLFKLSFEPDLLQRERQIDVEEVGKSHFHFLFLFSVHQQSCLCVNLKLQACNNKHDLLILNVCLIN